jgi:hypothetical protein
MPSAVIQRPKSTVRIHSKVGKAVDESYAVLLEIKKPEGDLGLG